jgi:uncharacterized protein
MTDLLLASPLSTLSVFSLALGILSLWLPSKNPIWMGFLTVTVITGFAEGRITGFGILGLLVLGIFCFRFYTPQISRFQRILFGILISEMTLALGIHKFPGFHNWLILPDTVISPNGLPLRLHLNFDKLLIGLFLIAWGQSSRFQKPFKPQGLKVILGSTLTATLVLIGLAITSGYVRWDPKWPSFAWVWLASNLIFTCVTEEAFFRGFLQEHLCRYFQKHRWGSFLGLGIASLIFGVAHLAGGWHYSLLAAIAGGCYGYAYLKTGRIEASIAVHFGVNALHFIGFTYPALKGAL